MKEVERELCKRNKVNEVIEIIIGYDGIVIANSNQSHRFDFTKMTCLKLYLHILKTMID